MSARMKRVLIFLAILVAFIGYGLALDPDTNLLSNLPFGAGILLSLQIVLMFALGLAVVEVITDFFTDRYFKFLDDKDIVEVIKRDPKAIAIYMLAWSIRILGYAILFGFAIVAYVGR